MEWCQPVLGQSLVESLPNLAPSKYFRRHNKKKRASLAMIKRLPGTWYAQLSAAVHAAVYFGCGAETNATAGLQEDYNTIPGTIQFHLHFWYTRIRGASGNTQRTRFCFIFFPRAILPLQSYRSLPCDHGLDFGECVCSSRYSFYSSTPSAPRVHAHSPSCTSKRKI